VGREVVASDTEQRVLEAYARRIGEAVARRDFERARELIDEAVRLRG